MPLYITERVQDGNHTTYWLGSDADAHEIGILLPGTQSMAYEVIVNRIIALLNNIREDLDGQELVVDGDGFAIEPKPGRPLAHIQQLIDNINALVTDVRNGAQITITKDGEKTAWGIKIDP